MTWTDEARGIEPWAGARLVDGPCALRCCGDAEEELVDAWRNGMMSVRDWSHGSQTDTRPWGVIDLSDPDTRAAFDRRLALRLGAPAEAVEEGVCFSRRGGYWSIAAGYNPHSGARWERDVEAEDGPPIDTPDPLLARVRAWWTVKA